MEIGYIREFDTSYLGYKEKLVLRFKFLFGIIKKEYVNNTLVYLLPITKSMKLNKSYPEDLSDRKALALMTTDRSKRMSELKGVVVEPESWVLYEGEDQKGESVEILTLVADGEIFSTISPTFIRKFRQIVDYFGNDVGEIVITSGTSKAGREFISVDVNWN